MKIKNELFLYFSILSIGTFLFISAAGLYYLFYKNRCDQSEQAQYLLREGFYKQEVCVYQFLASETVNEQFYSKGISSVIDDKLAIDLDLEKQMNQWMDDSFFEGDLLIDLKEVRAIKKQQDSLFNKLVSLVWERGFKDYGLVGLMRNQAHLLERDGSLDGHLLLSLRRREKDYIIRHDTFYVASYNKLLKASHQNLDRVVKDDFKRLKLNKVLSDYGNYFKRLVELDKKIGINASTGLKGEVQKARLELNKAMDTVLEDIISQKQNMLFRLKLFYVLFIISLLLISIMASAYLSRKITKPLMSLSTQLRTLRGKEMSSRIEMDVSNRSHEIKVLTHSFNQLWKELGEREQERSYLMEQISNSENMFRNLADKLPQCVFETDANDQITYVNRHWCDRFGYTDEELIGHVALSDIISSKSKKSVARRDEVVAIRKNRTFFPALLYVDKIIHNGVVVGKRGVVVDISERDRYLRLLKSQHEEAMQANAIKSAFLANISHEVRTPLNAIVGFASALKLRVCPTDDTRFYFDEIEKGASELLVLFNDMIEFSRIEARQLFIKPSPLNAKQQLVHHAKIVKELQRQMNKEHLCVKLDSTNAEGAFLGDEVTLSTIFRHLITNALKYTSSGQITLSCRRHSCFMVFCVSDSGIGIDAAKMNQIFEPFQQVDGSLTRNFQGAGIGLALCKGLLKAINGRIWCESTRGKGSNFYFSLPVVEASLNDASDVSHQELLLSSC